jgi:hypothetical protein
VVQKLIAPQARPIDLKLAQLQVKETQLDAFQNLRDELQTFQSVLQVAIANNATVQDVVDAINGSGADVTSTIINDGSPVNPLKIQIQGNQPGTANAVTGRVFRDFVIFEVDDVTFTTTQAATDASLIVDGPASPGPPTPLAIS